MIGEDLISIVVPVYNVELYLKKCVDSISNQTYRNIEIIIVDDGSTDNSGKLCDILSNSDCRIKVIHKKNGGLSSARNAGIDIASGNYIGFVDSDDWIEKDMVESLYLACIQNGSRIACCGRYKAYENGRVNKINVFNELQVWDIEESLSRLLTWDGIDSAAWDKLYDISLFKDIRYPDGRWHEDIPVTYKLFIDAKKVVHIGSPKYYYLQRSNGITRGKFNSKRMDLYLFSEDVCEYICNNFSQLNKQAECFLIRNMSVVLMGFKTNKRGDRVDYNKLWNTFCKLFRSAINNNYIPLYEKIKMILLRFHATFLFYMIKDVKGLIR